MRVPGTNLYSAAGYLSECGPLNFTVPFYSDRSRVRISTDAPPVCKIACRSGLVPVSTRLSLSAADDAQLGFFLGAPPLLRVPDGLAFLPPCYGWDPALLDTVKISPDTVINAVVTDALDVFVQNTVDVTSTSGLNVSVGNIPSVSVVGTVSATIPDNTPVIIRGLDSSSTPQTFAALPNVDGNHTISACVNAVEALTTTIRPANLVDVSGGSTSYNLGTVTIL